MTTTYETDKCRMWIWRNGLAHTTSGAPMQAFSELCGRFKPKNEPCCEQCKRKLSKEAIEAICAGKFK